MFVYVVIPFQTEAPATHLTAHLVTGTEPAQAPPQPEAESAIDEQSNVTQTPEESGDVDKPVTHLTHHATETEPTQTPPQPEADSETEPTQAPHQPESETEINKQSNATQTLEKSGDVDKDG